MTFICLTMKSLSWIRLENADPSGHTSSRYYYLVKTFGTEKMKI